MQEQEENHLASIDASVAGLTRLCPEEVEACLADSVCALLLPTLEFQASNDILVRSGVLFLNLAPEFSTRKR